MGAARKTVQYDELSPLQFVIGFLKSVQFEPSPVVRDCMIEYLVKLSQDAVDVSWPIARGANAVVYSQLEQNRVSWSNSEEIDRLRMLYTQRAAVTEATDSGPRNSNTQQKRIICTNFNNNRCNRTSVHDKDSIT